MRGARVLVPALRLYAPALHTHPHAREVTVTFFGCVSSDGERRAHIGPQQRGEGVKRSGRSQQQQRRPERRLQQQLHTLLFHSIHIQRLTITKKTHTKMNTFKQTHCVPTLTSFSMCLLKLSRCDVPVRAKGLIQQKCDRMTGDDGSLTVVYTLLSKQRCDNALTHTHTHTQARTKRYRWGCPTPHAATLSVCIHRISHSHTHARTHRRHNTHTHTRMHTHTRTPHLTHT